MPPEGSATRTPRPVVALTGAMAGPARATLESDLTTDWDIRTWTAEDPEDHLATLLAAADAVVPGIDSLFVGAFFRSLRASPKLRLLQIPFAGTDWLKPDLLPARAVAAGCGGHEIPMAEYAIAALLEWEIRFRVMDPVFRAGSWEHAGSSKEPGAYHGEVHGKTLGIVGLGGIGIEAAKRARAFGMRIAGLKRTPLDPCPDYLDRVYATAREPDALHALLRESDFVLLACDLNADTHGLLGEAEFAAMKDTAVLVNVARGEVAQEEPFYAALRNGAIAGAVIDTWYRYPARGLGPGETPADPSPSALPFADLPNVIMTPHCSAHTRAADRRRLASIAANLDALARGEPLARVMVRGSDAAPA